MPDQMTVTSAQLEALAAKLEGMSGGFDPDEAAALQALFALAGDAIAERDQGEVQGFGIMPSDQGSQFNVGFSPRSGQQGTQGVLIGLLRGGSSVMQDFHFRPGAQAMGDGSV
jgi:hypothetical protein